jgi:hypothetical protein
MRALSRQNEEYLWARISLGGVFPTRTKVIICRRLSEKPGGGSIAKRLEDDITLLIKELMMMFLESKIVTALAKVLKGTTTDETAEMLTKHVAIDAFPDFANNRTIDYHCYCRLTKSLNPADDDGVSQAKSMALKDKVRNFVKKHVLLSDKTLDKGKWILTSTEVYFLDRMYGVCQFLLMEALEMSNNMRLADNLLALTPGNLRWSINGDQQLCEVFSSKLIMEFYYPSHQHVAILR